MNTIIQKIGLSILMLMPTLGFSQNSNFASPTKTETENWILEKLNNYSKERKELLENPNPMDRWDMSSVIYNNYKFSFDGKNYLIVGYSETFYHNTTVDYVDYIPVYDIDHIYNDYDAIRIYTNSSTIKSTNKNTNKTMVEGVSNIGFRTNAETNLVKRLEAAFNHLKMFYSKPVNNEVF